LILASDRLDLVYRVLDLQLVDIDDRRCGKVDDVELAGEPLRAVALLVGSGVYPRRMPGRRLAQLARRVVGAETLGGNVVRVPWEEIDAIGATIKLKRPAAELGLGRGDDELAPVVGRLLLARKEEQG
jgi:sporulation protein YlmC with PRC-barrel domain